MLQQPKVRVNCQFQVSPFFTFDAGTGTQNPSRCLNKCNLNQNCLFFNFVFKPNKACYLYSVPRMDCRDHIGQPPKAISTCKEGLDDELSKMIAPLKLGYY